jgi:NitT/TauT family transport system ATP-binding protein
LQGGNPLIEAQSLGKTYETLKGRPVEALKDITLEIKDGEFTSILGPSGCGKSTFLKIVGGLIPATRGTMSVNGQLIVEPRQDIGIVFQSALLLDWRTVLENVMVPVEVLKLPRAEYRERALELLELTGLSKFVHNYPNELSGGMQQRVAICRALVFDPAILLLDEPFGALDAMTRDYMNLELAKIWDRTKKTVLLITHSIREAVFLSDRVFVMSPAPGRIVEVIDIDIAQPRALDVVNTPPFGAYERQIRRYFDQVMFRHGEAERS